MEVQKEASKKFRKFLTETDGVGTVDDPDMMFHPLTRKLVSRSEYEAEQEGNETMARKKRVRGMSKRKPAKGRRKRSKRAKALRGTTKRKRRKKGKRKSKTPKIDAFIKGSKKRLRGMGKRKKRKATSDRAGVPTKVLVNRADRLGKTAGGRIMIKRILEKHK